MIPSPFTVNVPLRTDEDGVIRVGGTRIPLETVIHTFQRGETPEQIIDSFDVLKLSDVYAVIAYYLQHRDLVDEYLQQVEVEAEAIRRKYEDIFPQEDFKSKLLARLEEKKRQSQEQDVFKPTTKNE